MGEIIQDIWQYDFLWRACVAAIVVALVAAPLGCCIVWQRMVYFGDALAHTTLLGAALGIVLGVQLQISIILVCVLVAISLVLMQGSSGISNEISKNTQLSIIAHGSLALALVLLTLQAQVPFDLNAFLFGDVLSITLQDLLWLILTACLVFLGLFFSWNNVVMMIVHRDLAQVEGVPVRRTQVIFMLLIALMVAIAMKVVGILLIVSLLIIPAATVRSFAQTPEAMAVLSGVVSLIAVVGGLLGSIVWDIPTGPAIVLMLVLLFIVVQLIPRAR